MQWDREVAAWHAARGPADLERAHSQRAPDASASGPRATDPAASPQHAAAAEGVAGTGGPLPRLDLAQRSFDTLVTVVRRTMQPSAAERWCYVTTPDHGAAGFCEECYLAIDPPEPRARLHRVEDGATLGRIARDAYGEHITGGNDERL